MEKQNLQPVCGEEALSLLNCVAESPFDQEKCLRFLQSLRECVLSKKVKIFSIPSQDQGSEGSASATKENGDKCSLIEADTWCRCCLSFNESSYGSTKYRLFTDLQNSLEVTAKPLRDGTALEAGKDIVRITWKLMSSAKVDADAAFKTIKVVLCYAPISQVDRPWRKTHIELFKDKTCPHENEIVSKPYEKTHQTLDWTIELDIPTGTYFVRVYAVDANGHGVPYGQNTDERKTTNLFTVEGNTGRKTSIDLVSACFSLFSVVSLFVFIVREKKKKKSQVRTEEVSSS